LPYEVLTGQLAVVITLAIGALLIALYPLLHKENRYFAWFSLTTGVIVWLLLIWFTFGDEVIRYQILKYGLH
jgi:Kef-type K+ transport system membrane component KefB